MGALLEPLPSLMELAGSIYILVIIALANLRVQVAKSIGEFAWRMANLMRPPDEGEYSMNSDSTRSHTPQLHLLAEQL